MCSNRFLKESDKVDEWKLQQLEKFPSKLKQLAKQKKWVLPYTPSFLSGCINILNTGKLHVLRSDIVVVIVIITTSSYIIHNMVIIHNIVIIIVIQFIKASIHKASIHNRIIIIVIVIVNMYIQASIHKHHTKHRHHHHHHHHPSSVLFISTFLRFGNSHHRTRLLLPSSLLVVWIAWYGLEQWLDRKTTSNGMVVEDAMRGLDYDFQWPQCGDAGDCDDGGDEWQEGEHGEEEPVSQPDHCTQARVDSLSPFA